MQVTYAQKTLKELVAEEKAAKEAEKKAKAEEKARQEAEKKAREEAKAKRDAALCSVSATWFSAAFLALLPWRAETRVKESCHRQARMSRIATNLIAPLLCMIVIVFSYLS